jgi:hypothetical protein
VGAGALPSAAGGANAANAKALLKFAPAAVGPTEPDGAGAFAATLDAAEVAVGAAPGPGSVPDGIRLRGALLPACNGVFECEPGATMARPAAAVASLVVTDGPAAAPGVVIITADGAGVVGAALVRVGPPASDTLEVVLVAGRPGIAVTPIEPAPG